MGSWGVWLCSGLFFEVSADYLQRPDRRVFYLSMPKLHQPRVGQARLAGDALHVAGCQQELAQRFCIINKVRHE